MSTPTTHRFVPGASRGWLEHFELSWRALRRAPSFTVPAVVTIALGIGAATAVFSLVYAILLRPFPYPDADRLVRVFTVAEGEQGAERNCSLLDIEEYNRRSSLLENIGGYTVFDSQIEGDGLAEAVVIAQLNQEAMHAVGVQPVLGRLFTEEEDRKGGPVNKALLGHGLWQRRYGGAPDALGQMLRLPMGEFEVVGVMPAGYGYPDRATLWLTMESWYALGLDTYREKQRDQRWYPTVARLAHGVSLEQAQDEMGAVARQLATEFPATNRDVGVRLVPLRDAEVGEVRPYLMLLAGGVSLVLLICIFNVANLLFARALTQRRQYVLQAALGGGTVRADEGIPDRESAARFRRGRRRRCHRVGGRRRVPDPAARLAADVDAHRGRPACAGILLRGDGDQRVGARGRACRDGFASGSHRGAEGRDAGELRRFLGAFRARRDGSGRFAAAVAGRGTADEDVRANAERGSRFRGRESDRGERAQQSVLASDVLFLARGTSGAARGVSRACAGATARHPRSRQRGGHQLASLHRRRVAAWAASGSGSSGGGNAVPVADDRSRCLVGLLRSDADSLDGRSVLRAHRRERQCAGGHRQRSRSESALRRAEPDRADAAVGRHGGAVEPVLPRRRGGRRRQAGGRGT